MKIDDFYMDGIAAAKTLLKNVIKFKKYFTLQNLQDVKMKILQGTAMNVKKWGQN